MNLVAPALTFLSFAGAAPALAQQTAEATESDGRICDVGAASAVQDGVREIHALCWGTGVVLGSAAAFQSFANPEIEATIVELEREGSKRVILLRPDAEGLPLLETLDGTLAASAGRSPWAGLEGLSFDYSGFAENGRIGIAPGTAGQLDDPGQAAASEGGVPSSAIEVSIGEHIASDAQRIAAAEASEE